VKKTKRRHKFDPVMMHAPVLPHYIRHEITARGVMIKWTSRFKKRYSDVIKYVSAGCIKEQIPKPGSGPL
jgi:hypothetical protein